MKIELLDNEAEWFIDEPTPLVPAKYVNIAILRRTVDYAAFRTEADKYTNSVATSATKNSEKIIERALILASKQKAVERRHESKIIRDVKPEAEDCYLKDNLCLKCPVCALNGGIRAEKGAGEISIKSRVLYQTAFSILPFEDIVESVTFNAVNERTIKTGQALGERELVKPNTHFISVVTLLAPTVDELKFYLYSMLKTTRYGAETRGMGVIENKLLGVVLADTETFTALGITQDVYEDLVKGKESPDLTYKAILDVVHSKVMTHIKSAKKVFSKEEVPKLEEALRGSAPTKEWVDDLYAKAQKLREKIQEDSEKKSKK